MPAITYKDWGGGLDRRIALSVQDADKLWVLKNAYISAGKKIVKRPGLKFVTNGLLASVGLENLNGNLYVFVPRGSGTFVKPDEVGAYYLDPYDPLGTGTALLDVKFARIFEGYPYVVALHYTRHQTGSVPAVGGIGPPVPVIELAPAPRHHYIDTNPNTIITDINCPHGESAVIVSSRVFGTGTSAAFGDVVRYCAAGSARDWTTASDAGFLPTSLNQDTTEAASAVGSQNGSLVVMFPEGAQIWSAPLDPAEMAIEQRLFGVGTSLPGSLATFYRDLVFASPYGIRSLSVQESVERIDENDVGVPVDSLVVAAQNAHVVGDGIQYVSIRGYWLAPLGQYWIVYRVGDSSKVYAYSYSRSAKLACWSEYTFPITIRGVAVKGGKVYVRSLDVLYELDAATYTDNTEPIDVDVQMAFQDAKLPGVEKMWYGADFVFSGTVDVSYLYDPADLSKETAAQTITGDTRSRQLAPVEVTCSAIAPRFQHSADEAFSLDLATLYYHALSAQV